MKIQTKSVLSICALSLAVPVTTEAAPVLLVGWDNWQSGGELADYTGLDASGSASEAGGDWREDERGASNDGTFGTLAGASTAVNSNATGTYLLTTNTTEGTYEFTITAGSTGLILETFHFDARRKRNNSATTYTVSSVSGAITIDASIESGSLGGNLGSNGPTDQTDYDVSLTGLADNVLAAGESATFRVAFTGGNNINNDQQLFFDNVAISGSAVPEPASLALIGLGSLLIARRRRA